MNNGVDSQILATVASFSPATNDSAHHNRLSVTQVLVNVLFCQEPSQNLDKNE